jgi:hypothetical protein
MMAKPFRGILSEALELAAVEDPLEPELFASQIAGLAWGMPAIDLDFGTLFGKELVRFAQGHGGPGGAALLLALAAVQPGWASQASAAARQLMAKGVSAPGWAAAIGRPRFTAAWLGIEPLGDQDVLLAGFAYDGQAEHALQVLIDNNLDGIAKDISLMAGVDQVLREWHKAMPELRFLPLDAETAARRLADALRVSDEYGPEGPMNADFRPLRALAKARLRQLPASRPDPAEPLEEAARQTLVREFFSSPESAPVRHLAQAELIASRLVDYRCDYGDGQPLRWSPAVVELCLCDWYPRKVAADEAETGHVAAVLRAWVRYAGRRRGLTSALVEETDQAITEYAPAFVEAMRTPARYGPAKAVLLEMQRDGVDLSDMDGVQRWVDAFNARQCAL